MYKISSKSEIAPLGYHVPRHIPRLSAKKIRQQFWSGIFVERFLSFKEFSAKKLISGVRRNKVSRNGPVLLDKILVTRHFINFSTGTYNRPWTEYTVGRYPVQNKMMTSQWHNNTQRMMHSAKCVVNILVTNYQEIQENDSKCCVRVGSHKSAYKLGPKGVCIL